MSVFSRFFHPHSPSPIKQNAVDFSALFTHIYINRKKFFHTMDFDTIEAALANNATDIKLTSNITLSSTLTISSDVNINLIIRTTNGCIAILI